ncbi:MAG: DNA-binding helix-turn-helix protein [Clostridiaceae bacterium]|jgi:GTP pyrophosphokinase|nr:DNA-binding helix-turn-helix protein [Clostridiaceae bacterium]
MTTNAIKKRVELEHMGNKLFDVYKLYTYNKGFAMGAGMTETLKALSYARDKHKDQKRKDGTPYFIHPLTMASYAVSMGIKDDSIIAMIMLHDVAEDCNTPISDFPVNDDIKLGVKKLTFEVLDGETKEEAKKRYYNSMLDDKRVIIVKCIDRCHNVSSMAGVFSNEKLQSYIDETYEYILPLIRKAKDKYPEYSNLYFLLKYSICSVIDSIQATLISCQTSVENEGTN